MELTGEVNIKNSDPMGQKDNTTQVRVYGYEAVTTSFLSVKRYQRFDVDSNNSVILGFGAFKVRNFDIKAKAYLKTSNISVDFTGLAFLSSNNVTVKNCTYLLNSLESNTNESSVRFFAYYYL